MPTPSGLIAILYIFLIGFFMGAGWTLSEGLIRLLSILFGTGVRH